MESLFNKWRPKSFAEIVGQNAVTSVLARQIATKTFKNCYLFCGAWGDGKTTTARVFASEVNGGNGYAIEIDGASNNGVDNIRELIEDAQQSSIDQEYKCYILDEVQSLTPAAWNAALKLIEEPPSHCIFIFCTTEPEKLPSTILSRVQRFDFHKVPADIIQDRLEFILNEEEKDKKYDKEALHRIAELADGHVRDAISNLEKCVTALDYIDVKGVESVLGIPSMELMRSLGNSLIKGDLSTASGIIDTLSTENSNMVKVYDQFLNYVVDTAISTIGKDMKEDVKNKLMSLLERLVELRRNLDGTTAMVFLKTIALEMSK